MSPDAPPPASFSRLDPETSARLNAQRQAAAPTRTHRIVEYTLFAVFGTLMILAGIAVYTMYAPGYRTVPNHFDEGVAADRINMLVIGIGGETHIGDGKDLADAIMLVSIKPSTRQVALISVPRDLYVDMGRYGQHRINSAHAIGEASGFPGAGPGLLVHTVQNVFQQPVHAFARVDFAAFRKIIDDLGGVEIYVEQDFHDFLFNDGFRKGWQKMSGERALRYARYRYIDSELGTNFSRESRQQQVLTAIQKKLRDSDSSHALSLIRTARTLSKATDTNLTTAQLMWLYRNFGDLDSGSIQRVSLQPYMRITELERSLTDSGEIVQPRDGSYDRIRNLTRSVFETGARVPAEPASPVNDGALASGPGVVASSVVRQ